VCHMDVVTQENIMVWTEFPICVQISNKFHYRDNFVVSFLIRECTEQ